MANFCAHCGTSLTAGAATPAVKSTASMKTRTKPVRKASAYSKKYGKAFKSLSKKNMKKSGGWKKGGYARTVKQAHAKAKRMR